MISYYFISYNNNILLMILVDERDTKTILHTQFIPTKHTCSNKKIYCIRSITSHTYALKLILLYTSTLIVLLRSYSMTQQMLNFIPTPSWKIFYFLTIHDMLQDIV
jgi:hypothetical protein